jgi:hypothetical protein
MWFKIDDTLADHDKVLKAGNAAMGLWVRCGAWSARQLTEGFIPKRIARLYGRPSLVKVLLESGLWCESEDGYQMHDFLDYNPSKEKVLSERRAATERQRRAREAATEKRSKPSSSRRDKSVTHAVSHADVTPVVTVPPSRPVLPSEVQEVSNETSTTPSVSRTDVIICDEPATAAVVPAAPQARPQTAQTLIGEWIDAVKAEGGHAPAGRDKGQVARLLAEMLAEGLPYEAVRRGLVLWHQKRLHPATLPSVVREASLGPATAPRTAAPNYRTQQVESMFASLARMSEDEGAQVHGDGISWPPPGLTARDTA